MIIEDSYKEESVEFKKDEKSESFVEASTGGASFSQPNDGESDSRFSQGSFVNSLVAQVQEGIAKNVKQELVSDLIRTNPQVAVEASNIIQNTTVKDFMAQIKAKSIKKKFKIAGKQSQAQVISAGDFKKICQENNAEL